MNNRWNEEINQITQEFNQTFRHLSNTDLNFKPKPDVWSIAQNINHLIMVNQSYFDVVNELINQTYKTPYHARFKFITNLFGKMILGAVNPDRARKFKTFGIWEPNTSNIPEGILERFTEQQNSLNQLINNSLPLLDKSVVISSPANKNIVYKLETAFDIITSHEKRHLIQAKELLKLI
jgi:hypothetical protein